MLSYWLRNPCAVDWQNQRINLSWNPVPIHWWYSRNFRFLTCQFVPPSTHNSFHFSPYGRLKHQVNLIYWQDKTSYSTQICVHHTFTHAHISYFIQLHTTWAVACASTPNHLEKTDIIVWINYFNLYIYKYNNSIIINWVNWNDSIYSLCI